MKLPPQKPRRVTIKKRLQNLFWVVLLFSFFGLKAQNYRPVPDSTWQALTADDELHYAIDLSEPELSLWQKFWLMLTDFWRQLVGQGIGGSWLRYLFYALAIALVLYGLYRLFEMDKMGLFKSNKKAQFTVIAQEENLAKRDLDQELAQARAAQDWRLCVRLQYLRVLKALDRARIIEVKAGKTNHQYSYEIENARVLHSFKKLSQLFDYAWYGGFEINRRTAQKCDEEVQNLLNSF